MTSEPIAVLYPTAPSTVTETFRLSDDCTGLIWRDRPSGWSGCLRGPAGDSNFVGPFKSIVGARLAVRSEYVAAQSATPRDTAHIRGL
mgnify:CR=1 FL=1